MKRFLWEIDQSYDFEQLSYFDNQQVEAVSFTGHRKIKEDDLENVTNQLHKLIRNYISKGVKVFNCGGAVGFDTLAASIVLDLRLEFRDIQLVLYIPCSNQDEKFSFEDRITYKSIRMRADKVIYVSELPYHLGCMQTRNRALVDNCSYCIAYLRKDNGGTAYTVKYAKKKGIKTIVL